MIVPGRVPMTLTAASDRFRIVPQGSFSKVTKHGDERKTHELYVCV